MKVDLEITLFLGDRIKSGKRVKRLFWDDNWRLKKKWRLMCMPFKGLVF